MPDNAYFFKIGEKTWITRSTQNHYALSTMNKKNREQILWKSYYQNYRRSYLYRKSAII